jgi:hypothetical protein
VVIDGADNFPVRYLLNDACVKLGKPLVYGAVHRFEGQVSVYDAGRHRGVVPCYRCLFPEPPPPEAAPNCAEAGVLGVLPGVIGLLQATEAIKLILGIGESLAGRLLSFDALSMRSAKPGCGRTRIAWCARRDVNSRIHRLCEVLRGTLRRATMAGRSGRKGRSRVVRSIAAIALLIIGPTCIAQTASAPPPAPTAAPAPTTATTPVPAAATNPVPAAATNPVPANVLASPICSRIPQTPPSYAARIALAACVENSLWFGPFIDPQGRLASITVSESERLRLRDGSTPAWQRVAEYWKGSGLLAQMSHFPGAADCSYGGGGHLQAASCRAFLSDTPWSAVFVSYVMARAGLPGFNGSASHIDFVRDAYRHPESSPYTFNDPDVACRLEATCCAFRAGATRSGRRGCAISWPAVPATG